MSSTIRVGNTYNISVTVKNSNGTVKDLSNITEVVYQVAKTVNTPTPILVRRLTTSGVTIPNPLNGIVKIQLTGQDTLTFPIGAAYHEALLCDNQGNIMTILSENITVTNQLIKSC